MSVTAIVILALLALAQPVLRGWGRHALLGASVQTVALGLAAILAAAADPVAGFWRNAALVVAVAAVALSADPVVRAAFTLARRSTAATEPPADHAPDDDDGQPGPLRGGLAIGILERSAIAAAVLTHWPEGIAVVLAVKGLARYPELRRADASEQFIIGTFTSVLWALAICGVATLLIT
ncbi:hypothetical protein [Tomitella biformata]|uniref:hypothetical protein n=1 Tax=Tomitella biformata TaxID=630403 RepID=UPI0004655050|nr:hypothetical protein [Tomitella biformata]